MTSQSIADYVVITLQVWREHVNVISNSLGIDFIHGDIHGRSCKKCTSFVPYIWAILIFGYVNKRQAVDTAKLYTKIIFR